MSTSHFYLHLCCLSLGVSSVCLCVISVSDEPEEAAASDPPGSSDDSAVTNAPQPADVKPPVSTDSPSRRASRSRIKLAANFSFTAGLWSVSHIHAHKAILAHTECNSKCKSWPATLNTHTGVRSICVFPSTYCCFLLNHSSAIFVLLFSSDDVHQAVIFFLQIFCNSLICQIHLL